MAKATIQKDIAAGSLAQELRSSNQYEEAFPSAGDCAERRKQVGDRCSAEETAQFLCRQDWVANYLCPIVFRTILVSVTSANERAPR